MMRFGGMDRSRYGSRRRRTTTFRGKAGCYWPRVNNRGQPVLPQGQQWPISSPRTPSSRPASGGRTRTS
eukprot:8277147-Heterocapsa_arctica.AAC.1